MNPTITNIRIFDKELTPFVKALSGRSVSFIDSLFLNRHENNITFEFSSLDYISSTGSRYAYRLINADIDWNTIDGSENRVTYSNLMPGEYIFEIKASSRQGTWSDKTKSVYLFIKPPFWQESWFRFIILTIVIIAIFLFFQIREYNYKLEKTRLAVLVDERTNELLEQKIQVEAWSPLMQGKIISEPVVQKISEKYHKTPAQIALRWNLQHGVVTIPKSARPDRITENAQIFDFEITAGDMKTLDSLDEGRRIGPDPDNFNF